MAAADEWPPSGDPTGAWEALQPRQHYERVDLTVGEQPPDTLRIVCLSDTHGHTDALSVPPGDVLVHAGDFTNEGEPHEVVKFNEFLKTQPHRHKLVIAGNHEMTFDERAYPSLRKYFHPHKRYVPADVKALLQDCVYLEDSGCTIDGVLFWGSPWQPVYCDWAFNAQRGEPLAKKWEAIPSAVDVLVTHGPPVGHGDLCRSGTLRVGCVDLLRAVQTRIRLRVHIFGHVHEGHGVSTDGRTTFINASICTRVYEPTNPPIVIDVPKGPAAPLATKD